MKKAINFETESEVLDEASAAFNSLISTLEEEPSFEKYQFGITKMFDFFKDEYNKNVKLLTNCQEMNAQIVVNATKINLIQKSTFSDAENLQKMKQDFEDATSMVQSVHKSEMRSKQILNTLRKQIRALNDQIQSGSSFSFGASQSVFEASNEVNNLKKELNKSIEESKNIKQQIRNETAGLDQAMETNKMLTNEFNKLAKTLTQIDKRITIIQQENDETSQSILDLKPVLHDMKESIANLQKDKISKQNSLQQMKNNSIELFGSFNSAKDESRQRKDKVSRKQQRLAESQNTGVIRKQKFESMTDKLKELDSYLVDINEVLNNETKKLAENNKIIEAAFESNENVLKEKNKVRLHLKEMFPEISEAIIKLNENESVRSYINRQIDGAKEQLTALKMNNNEAKHAFNEVKGSEVVLKSEMVTKKTSMQSQKDKIIEIIKDIDATRTAFFKTNADMLCVNDANNVMVEENEKLVAEHANLLSKLEMQQNISDQTREERNTYAGQLRAKEAENEQLERSISELTSLVSSSKVQSEQLFNNTIDAHFRTRNSNDSIDSIIQEIEEIKSHTRKVERIISHLQAENQTLNYIIKEASTDHIILEKEQQLLKKTISMFQEQINQKQRQSDEVNAKIMYLERLVDSNRSKYNDKINELKNLYNELETRTKATEVLEKKVEHVDLLNYKMQKATTSLVVERRKYVVLVHELAVPRNVHRWEVIEAVDPHYVKSIRFRMDLSDRLKEVILELSKVKQIRDDLKKSIADMNQTMSTGLTRKQAEQYIEKYKESIKLKDAEMASMEDQIKSMINPIKDKGTTVLTMRGKVNKRRESACAIKNEIYETARSTDCMFMTEGKTVSCMPGALLPPRPVMVGGGFAVVITPKPQRRGAKSSNILKVGTSPVITRNTTRTQSRPLYNSNYQLPSMRALY